MNIYRYTYIHIIGEPCGAAVRAGASLAGGLAASEARMCRRPLGHGGELISHVCVCVCVGGCVYMHTYMHTYITYIHMYSEARMCRRPLGHGGERVYYIDISTYICISRDVEALAARIYMYVCVCVCVYIYIYR